MEHAYSVRWHRWLVAAAIVALLVARWAGVAAAAVPDPTPQQPPGSGSAQLLTIIGWARWGVGISALLAFMIGGIMAAVGHFGENYGAAVKARKWILGAVGGVLLAVMAAPLLNALGA